MELSACLNRMCKAYQRYYDIYREGPACAGFDALAAYHQTDANYILNKANTIYSTEQHEYAYFALVDTLDKAQAQVLIDRAREAGLAQIKPHKEHMFSYVTLMVIANTITDDAKSLLKRYRYSKNYRLSLHGWMEFHIAAMETSTNGFLSNPAGKKACDNFRQNFKPEKI